MRSLCGIAVALLVLAVLLGGCAGAPKQETAPDTVAIAATIDSLMRALGSAIAAGDTAAIVGFYADDAVILPDHAPRIDGMAAIRVLWAGFYRIPGFKMTLAPAQEMVSPSGDMVVSLGTWEFEAQGPQGKRLHDVGKSVSVFRQVGGQWKIQLDTWNSDQPPPGQAKP